MGKGAEAYKRRSWLSVDPASLCPGKVLPPFLGLSWDREVLLKDALDV